MSTIKPVIAIQRILDTVCTIAFNPISDCEAEILALTRKHHDLSDNLTLFPVFHLTEGEGRIVTTIHCKQLENGQFENTKYKVTNPKFLFSYSEEIPSDTHDSNEILGSKMDLEMLCQIEASGTFLTEHLTEELLNGDEGELNEFVDEHKWEPIENYEAENVIEMITQLGDSMERFIEESILGKLPNYAVIWHYEGESPTLFTCRAKSESEAEELLNAERMDHSSNQTEFYIDSIEEMKF